MQLCSELQSAMGNSVFTLKSPLCWVGCSTLWVDGECMPCLEVSCIVTVPENASTLRFIFIHNAARNALQEHFISCSSVEGYRHHFIVNS